MFKNKFVLGIIALGILASVYYLFSSAPTFAEKTNKEIEDYKTTLLTMDESPIAKLGKSGISFFEPDENWLFEADFEKSTDKKEFMVNMTDSTIEAAHLAGYVTLNISGENYRLLVFDEGANYVLPFKDLTNGVETYGGGRYINIEKGELIGNKLTVNFNNSHNYYCAYEEEYACPIPPKENSLPLEVRAGELDFKK